MGSCASIDHVQTKSSACVEVLRSLSHEVSDWFGVRDFHRGRKEVSIIADLQALCLDIATHKLHTTTADRHIISPAKQTKGRAKKTSSAVRDVLWDGVNMLMEKNLFDHWMKRTGTGAIDGDEGNDDLHPTFADPDGQMMVDTGVDPNFPECPFSNIGISTVDGDE